MAVSTFIPKRGLSGYVLVENKAGFPDPVAGVIQLLDNIIYRVNGAIPLGDDRLVWGLGTIVIGENNSHDSLSYTGTGACISAAGGNSIRVSDLGISAPNGAVFDGVDCPVVNIEGVVGTALRVGRFENCNVVIGQQSSIVEVESGIELVNTSTGALFTWLNGRIAQRAAGTGILINFGSSVWDSIQATEIELVSAVGGTDISGLANNGNLTAGSGRGRFFDSVINGAGTPLVGITPKDTLWWFSTNIGITDSIAIGSMVVTDNTTATVITLAATWMDLNLNALAVLASNASRFVLDNSTTGQIKYVGREGFPSTAFINISGEGQAGQDDYKFRLLVNGNPTSDAISAETSTNARTRDLTLIVPVLLVTDDLVRVQVQNIAGTDNWTARQVSMSIR